MAPPAEALPPVTFEASGPVLARVERSAVAELVERIVSNARRDAVTGRVQVHNRGPHLEVRVVAELERGPGVPAAQPDSERSRASSLAVTLGARLTRGAAPGEAVLRLSRKQGPGLS